MAISIIGVCVFFLVMNWKLGVLAIILFSINILIFFKISQKNIQKSQVKEIDENKLIEEIDSGRVEPRLFEVLAQLQNQIMQMPKNFSSYMTQMEKNYKQLKSESEEIKKSGDLQFDENGNILQTQENTDLLKARGTRSLMENLQNVMKGGSMIKDAEIVKNTAPEDNLINPRTKFGGTSDLSGGDNESDFEIEDELFD